jgi:hypothetical protein
MSPRWGFRFCGFFSTKMSLLTELGRRWKRAEKLNLEQFVELAKSLSKYEQSRINT